MKEFILPSRMNKRLISTLMSSKTTNTTKPAIFSIKSTSEFASRSGDIFGKLQTLEKNHEVWMTENPTLESFEEAKNSVCGNPESEIFKKPVPTKLWKPKYSSPSPFKRRPSKKWKKYSLEDVPITSDANNTAIALQCIFELRMRKEKALDVTDNSTQKLIFTKPKSSEKSLCTHSSTHPNEKVPILKQTALKRKNETKSPKIKLHHLQDDDCDI